MILTIRTMYKGPTDTRGSRFKAIGFGKSLSLPYDYELNSIQNHERVARALVDRENIKGKIRPTNDDLETGYRFLVEVD